MAIIFVLDVSTTENKGALHRSFFLAVCLLLLFVLLILPPVVVEVQGCIERRDNACDCADDMLLKSTMRALLDN